MIPNERCICVALSDCPDLNEHSFFGWVLWYTTKDVHERIEFFFQGLLSVLPIDEEFLLRSQKQI